MVPYALSRRRSIRLLLVTFALLTVLLAEGCTRPGGTGRPVPQSSGDSGRGGAEPATPGHELAGSLHGRTGAYLTVADAASRVDVRMAGLPGLLYRITTPSGSGLAPRVTGPDGRVR